jgi:hypothetical protein
MNKDIKVNFRLFQETYLAKHMQKHSDRPDKRPPIADHVPGQTVNPGVHGAGGGHNLSGANQNVTAAAAAVGLQGLAGSAAAAADAYWPKMDPYGVGHDRDYGFMDPRFVIL